MQKGICCVGLCATLFLTGCGIKSNGPPLMPVSGTVTLDGKPLPGATILFIPTGSTHGTSSGGRTDMPRPVRVDRHAQRQGCSRGATQGGCKQIGHARRLRHPVNTKVGPIDSPARESLPAKYSAIDRTALTAAVRDASTRSTSRCPRSREARMMCVCTDGPAVFHQEDLAMRRRTGFAILMLLVFALLTARAEFGRAGGRGAARDRCAAVAA